MHFVLIDCNIKKMFKKFQCVSSKLNNLRNWWSLNFCAVPEPTQRAVGVRYLTSDSKETGLNLLGNHFFCFMQKSNVSYFF